MITFQNDGKISLEHAEIADVFSITVKRILVAPLDWGLGHCTRIIPVVHDLRQKGHEVILAACGPGAVLLRSHFPDLLLLDDIPSYHITYPDHGSFVMHFLLKTPSLIKAIHAENKWLEGVVEKYKIDEVYSDNRYGLNHRHVRCRLITHQLNIPAPWYVSPWVRMMSSHYFDKFDQILVPDFNHAMNLSGALSHGRETSSKVKYIGPLSRFTLKDHSNIKPTVIYDCVAMISGPEPSRAEFEKALLLYLAETPFKCLLIQGKPDEPHQSTQGNIHVVNHLPDEELISVLKSAGLVICRSGYSSIMDLHALGLRAMLVPTPGQAEQIYLADYHHTAGRHIRVRQNELSAEKIQQVMKRINFAPWITQKQM